MFIFTTGGTIDKIYFDATSEYEIGDPTIPHIFREVGVTVDYELVSLMRKDSLEISQQDREQIREKCIECEDSRILITHGTDTMCETAEFLQGIEGKTIVLTGALQPAAFAHNDAVFNIGCSVAAVQTLSAGTYIVMNGRVFTPDNVVKNRQENRFEVVTT